MQNHSEIAEFLWKIADLIKDDYDAKDYEDVILPFTLLRRLDCVLQPNRQAVREAAVKYKTAPEQTRDALLMKAAGQKFYNTSEYSLEELIRRPADIVPEFLRLPCRVLGQRKGHSLQLLRWRGKRLVADLRNAGAQAADSQNYPGLLPKSTCRPKTSITTAWARFLNT